MPYIPIFLQPIGQSIQAEFVSAEFAAPASDPGQIDTSGADGSESEIVAPGAETSQVATPGADRTESQIAEPGAETGQIVGTRGE